MLKYIQSIKNKNGLPYFFIKAALLLMLFFIADFSLGKLFHNLYAKQKSGWEYRTKYAVEDTKADLLLFGSSRAQQQYNPLYFEDKLKMSCYNVGRDGESLLYQYTVFTAVLNRYTPKLILLECENGMFSYNTDSYDRLSCFLPFYKDHPEVRPIIQLRSTNERIKLLSEMYPYNSRIINIVSGLIGKDKEEDIKGYLPLYGSLSEPARTVNFSKLYKLDSNKLKFYNSIIEQCKKKNIELVMVCSPYFSKGYGNDTSLTVAKQIAQQNKLRFIDLSKGHPLLAAANLFDDTAHVNNTGSKILSNIIADSMVRKPVR